MVVGIVGGGWHHWLRHFHETGAYGFNLVLLLLVAVWVFWRANHPVWVHSPMLKLRAMMPGDRRTIRVLSEDVWRVHRLSVWMGCIRCIQHRRRCVHCLHPGTHTEYFYVLPRFPLESIEHGESVYARRRDYLSTRKHRVKA